MDLRAEAPPGSWAPLAAGAATAAVGALALAGWALGLPLLVRVAPGLSPVQPNAALGLLLAGVAVVLLARFRYGAAAWVAGAAGLVGLATLVEYAAGLDLGIDDALFEPVLRDGFPAPGRMAPNAALGLLLVGLGAVAIRVHRRRFTWAAVCGSLTFALGAVALLGYASEVEPAYGWGAATRLALLAALGLLGAGGGLFAVAWVRDRERPGEAPSWAPWVALMVVSAMALALGQALRAAEQAALRRSLADGVEDVRVELVDRLDGHVRSYVRMARRMVVSDTVDRVQWELDAWGYLTDLEGLRALAWRASERDEAWLLGDPDRALVPMPVVPGGAGPAAVVGEPRIRDGAGDSGRAQVMVSVPVSGAGGTLTAVYDAQDLLADLTRNEQPSFHLAVTGRSGVLYERRHVAHVVRWRRAAALDLHGSGWTLTLAPGREALDRELTWFPWVVAGSGLSLALLLCVALLQTRTARRHGRRAETALAGLRAEMVQRQLYEAELARSNAELERFAYVASHDLQEPLRQVASFVELLGQRYRGRLDADADDFIRYAVEGAHRLQRLIEDLLAYSRVGSRGRELEPTDASAALERALAHLELAIAEAGAVVEHEPLPRVMADEGQLVQVFQNLLSNAVKFHREGVAPRVRVTSRRADWMWEISVADNGIGIEAGYFERIFLIFQRLHGREEFPGTGIGLALARRIVERHGGRLWVESEPGQGSTFHFTLAAAGEEAP